MMYPDGQGMGVPQARAHAQTAQPYEEPRQAYLAQQNHTINFRVDEDAKNVLEQITPELREAFVTIAIKHFQYDPMFQHYFKKIMPQDIEIGTGQPNQPAPAGIPHGGPVQAPGQAVAPAAAVGGGFDDW